MNRPERKNLPYGIRCLKYIFHGCCEDRRVNFVMWQTGILALTYLAYTSYHMTRKPISVVKHTLSLNCSGLPIPPNITVNDTNRDTWCDWAPFSKNKYNIQNYYYIEI
jgi:OPA family glycerol-3-phosphate transporter-like MFS transporter 1/2